MMRTGRWKLTAATVALIAVLSLGVSQLPFSTESANATAEDQACLDPIKVFRFAPTSAERGNVSALMARVAPQVPLSRMRYAPEPTEILQHPDGRLELRYDATTLRHTDALEVSICAASPANRIQEAYWIVRERGQTVAQMIDEERITWSWRENGEQSVPGTQRVSKAFSCTGEPLVHQYQNVFQSEPLCVKDPEALARIQDEMARIQAEQTSFTGAVKRLVLGDAIYSKRIERLNAQMERLYVYSPYDGIVDSIRRDDMNDLVWIEMTVESGSNAMAGSESSQQ